LLTVTSIKAVKCILPLLFDSPLYKQLAQYRNQILRKIKTLSTQRTCSQ